MITTCLVIAVNDYIPKELSLKEDVPSGMIPIKRLNHAVLYVSDIEKAIDFYSRLFGMDIVAREGPMAFLRAKGSDNHHDLGLLRLGPEATPAPPGSTGLYHLAWQVDTIQDLAAARKELLAAGALRGESDHGATKSLYGVDPDQNEFEIMVLLPRDQWGEYEHQAPIQRLNWEKELKR
jgi:catechol-2,3-dioxygenase